MTASVTVGSGPFRVAVNEATNIVYATNSSEGAVSVIAPAASTLGAPSGVSATSGNGLATVAFTATTSDGGSAISGHTVTVTATTTPVNGGQTVSGAGTPIVVTGLTNGDRYMFHGDRAERCQRQSQQQFRELQPRNPIDEPSAAP